MSSSIRKWFGVSAMYTLLAMIAFIISMPAQADFCWRDSYGRGAGLVPAQCTDTNRAMDEGLCYNKCKPNWDGKATICYQNCPSGFRDDGLFCAKPAPYGVGGGFPWKFGDPAFNYDKAGERCRAETPGGSCSKEGLIWYPNCKAGFHKTGALICSPNCPSGWADIGVSCTKPSENRGAGLIPNACAGGKQMDAGLCYDNCKAKFNGVGPVCWQQCPPSAPTDCGAGCAASQSECVQVITEQVVSVLDTIATVATTVATFGAGTAAKAAATTAAKATVKNATKSAVKSAGKQAVKDIIKKELKSQGKDMAEAQIENLAKAQMGEDFDFATLDPTGIASIVMAYKKPICKAS